MARTVAALKLCALGLSAMVALVIVAACPSSQVHDQPKKSTVSWCGQRLTMPAFIASHGSQTLDPPTEAGTAPTHSVVPPKIASDSSELANWSNLVILSYDCSQGVIVSVTPSPYIRTVGVAYNNKHTGLTALLLGRVNSSPGAVSITVTAYRDGTDIGQALLQF